ncbi:MAG TPA: hypothetical protein VM144_09885 [Aestuariivirga sp.]|nr:hypothetical protein [Aestuariivirga sp.]
MLPANGAANPGSVKRRRKMAEAMLESGMSTSPIASPWQGIARLAQAAVGGYGQRKADQAEAEGHQSVKDAMAKALNGGDKASLIDAASNPWMDNNSLGMITNQWNQMNQPPGLKQLDNDQFYQYDPMNPQDGKAFTPQGYDPFMAGGDAEYGLQPIVTQEPPGPNGEPGKYHLFQASKNGGPPKEIALPHNWTPQQQFLDTGTGFQAVPKQGVGPGTVIPKNVAEEAALSEGGKQSEAVPAQVVQDYLKPNGVKEQDDAIIASISSIHEAKKLLDRGIQSGALADKLQSLRSLGAALGFDVDESVLTDTQTYQNFIRSTVIPKMKELGGNDSNEEMRMMSSLSGADITQQDATIRATLDLTEKLMAKKFKSRELYRKATKKYFGDTYEVPELPVYGGQGDGGWTVLPSGVKIRRKGQ